MAARVALHAYRGAGAAIEHITVNNLETGHALVQAHLKVDYRRAGRAAVVSAPFDIEYAVGRTPAYRSEYALPVGAIARIKVLPVREDCKVEPRIGQARVE